MASNGVSVQSIIDALFGCCIRPRRVTSSSNSGGFSSSDLARAEGGAHNERTPLLAGHKQSPSDAHKNNIRSNDGKQANPPASGEAGPHGSRGAIASVERVRRRTDVDPVRLKAIREQAQAAFFNIDSSQLLPSSSSLAQRQAGMGSSQRLGRRDHIGDGAEEETSYAAQQRTELIAASDKAERLYTAAMKSTKGEGAESDEDASVPVTAASTDAPVGLVRQVRLSVCDAKARKLAVGENETAGTASQTQADEAVHTLPSVHSLLRLGVAPALADDDANDDVSALLGVSSHSATTNGGASENAVSGSSAEDDRWERRGRTRSHRGLMWMVSKKEGEEPAAAGMTAVAVEGQTEAAVTDTALTSEEDHIQYGLRFEVKNGGERRKAIEEQLKQTSSQTLAVTWDESGDA